MALQRNTLVQLHRDAGNEPGLDNTVIPCSRWRGAAFGYKVKEELTRLDHTSGSGTMLSFRRTYRMPWLLGQTAIARS